MKDKSKFSARIGLEDLFFAAGLGMIIAGGVILESPLIGLVIPGAILVLLGLAPLRRLV